MQTSKGKMGKLDDDEIIEIPRDNEKGKRSSGAKISAHFHHHHCSDDEGEEFEHCFCHEHASFVQTRFHEVLLDFFSGQQNFDASPDHSTCTQFYDKQMFKDFTRERFGTSYKFVCGGI